MTVGSEPRFGSDVVVDLLTDVGIDLVAFSPGATFRGIHESLLNYGTTAPEIIECLHEEISVAVAHGYAKAAGRMAAVLLHDIVGLQHATMAIYNAWCDRVPLLALGGTGPVDAARRRPWIDWIHTANVQATQVRDYTKWDDQPASLAAVPESIIRAQQLATATPPGPVYVCLDSTVQEQPVDADFSYASASSYAAPSPVHADPSAIAKLADWCARARSPVIVVESVGRRQQTLEDLVAVAEAIGAAVLEPERDYNRSEMCFPTRHPLNLSGLPLPESPDLVLALEARDVTGIPGLGRARVAQVSTAQFAVKAWAADLQRIQPAELVIPAEVGPVLTALKAALPAALAAAPDSGPNVTERRHRLAEYSTANRAAWLTQARASRAQPHGGIHPAYLALALRDAAWDDDCVLANGNLHNWVHRLWDIDRADRYLGASGGAGLGYALGASIGAALAHRNSERLVIDIQSDGDALMTPSALWTAARYQVPLLIVMENNRAYGNSVMHADRISTQRGRSPARARVGTLIDGPAVDFAQLARSFGVEAIGPVEAADDLDAALREAAATVRTERRPVLVDVIASRAD